MNESREERIRKAFDELRGKVRRALEVQLRSGGVDVEDEDAREFLDRMSTELARRMRRQQARRLHNEKAAVLRGRTWLAVKG